MPPLPTPCPVAGTLLGALNRGELAAEILRMRQGDCAVLRVTHDEGSWILKVWARSGWSARTRRLTGTAPMQRELCAMEQLAHAGVRVPKALSHRIDEDGTPWTQALTMEDFGSCVPALDRVKALLTEGSTEKLYTMLESTLDMTRRMVEARVLDADHSLVNILAQPDDQLVRIDLELARKVTSVGLYPLLYGQMLGRLICSLVFAVQPATKYAENFAARVLGELHPPKLVRSYATRQIQSMLKKQRKTVGVDTNLQLPW